MSAKKRLPNLGKHGEMFEGKFKELISSFANKYNDEINVFDRSKHKAEVERLAAIERLVERERLEREQLSAEDVRVSKPAVIDLTEGGKRRKTLKR